MGSLPELLKALLVEDALQTKFLSSPSPRWALREGSAPAWDAPPHRGMGPSSWPELGRMGRSHQTQPLGIVLSQHPRGQGEAAWSQGRAEQGGEREAARPGAGIGSELPLGAGGWGPARPLQSQHLSQRWWGARSRTQSRGVGSPAESAGPRESGAAWQAAPGHVCSPRWSSPP